MKKIIAVGDQDIIGLLQNALGKDYIIKDCSHLIISRKRILGYIKAIITSDIVYFVGIFGYLSIYARIAKFFRKKVIYHWLGTDVWKYVRKEYVSPLNNHLPYVDLHLAYSINLQKELVTLGIESQLYTLVPIGIDLSCGKMPSEHAVLLSIPDEKAEFYGYSSMIEVIKRFPNLLFYVVRSNTQKMYDFPNVRVGILSREKMNRLYDDISIVIRYPEHDGLSLLLMEATIKGKEMIYKFTHPFAHHAETIDEICSVLDLILKEPPHINFEASQYGINEYSHEKCRGNGIKILSQLMNICL